MMWIHHKVFICHKKFFLHFSKNLKGSSTPRGLTSGWGWSKLFFLTSIRSKSLIFWVIIYWTLPIVSESNVFSVTFLNILNFLFLVAALLNRLPPSTILGTRSLWISSMNTVNNNWPYKRENLCHSFTTRTTVGIPQAQVRYFSKYY